MTYFEKALDFYNNGKLDDARKFLGYAKDYGTEEEKANADKLLAKLESGNAETIEADVHDHTLARPVKNLLEEKRYDLALEKLLALGDSANAEELYYLGKLHDDFGMGMPCDKEKAREYFKKSWELGYVDAGSVYVSADSDLSDNNKSFTPEQKKILEEARARGSAAATVISMLYDVKTCVEKNMPQKECEAAMSRYYDFVENVETENNFVRYIQACQKLESTKPLNRAYGMETLLLLRESWDTEIAACAWEKVAECFRDGIFFQKNLEKAKYCFEKVVSFGKKDVPESAQEFLSGKWQNSPVKAEEFAAWFAENFQQIKEILCFAGFSWCVALNETDPAYTDDKNAVDTFELTHYLSDYFSPKENLKDLRKCIEDSADFMERIGISEAKKIIDRSLQKEFAALEKVFEKMEAAVEADQEETGSIFGDIAAMFGATRAVKKIAPLFHEAEENFLNALEQVVFSLLENKVKTED